MSRLNIQLTAVSAFGVSSLMYPRINKLLIRGTTTFNVSPQLNDKSYS
jgi:hypothetical protein